MGKCRDQTTHLLAVYLSLLALGVLMELGFPLDSPFTSHSQDSRQNFMPLRALREKTSVEGDVDINKWRMAAVRLVIQSVSEPNVDVMNFSSLTGSDGPSVLNAANLTEEDNIRVYDDTNAREFVSDSNVLVNEEKRHPNIITHKVKFSTEFNAFDELTNLLTTSKTHCLAVHSLPWPTDYQDGARYRCSVHTFSDCHRRYSGNKLKKFDKLCPRHTRPGYEVNPVSMNPTSGGEGKKKLHKITIDAHYTFLEDLKGLKPSQRLRLDTKFDLAGLNSLHKYEITKRLLQMLRWTLTHRGYQLVRSSADSDDLFQYLHQEDLQPPLHVLTLWHRRS
ncbi:uncharacterized protein LOC121853627 [Homarus americanus]|uniref:Uncharacterized protein n=1 Tax=Homarus americanus TaxID=6706 RepID=A0A8J5MM73_HOMAM|nr:uncharacterized protein LOC121853627 [Homarus americanus]KAG7156623.1 hypothetical protein Hamer_G006608 [Homarus americanus]